MLSIISYSYVFLTFTALRTIAAIPPPETIPNAILRSSPESHAPSTLDIRITDSTGNDISNHINILHHHSLLSTRHSSTKEKRVDRLYTPKLCPPGWQTINSWCNYAQGPQVYQLTCKHATNDANVIELGRCSPTEICFDKVQYDATGQRAVSHRAYCVSDSDFEQLVLPEDGLGPSQRGVRDFSATMVGLPGPSGGGRGGGGQGQGQYALEVIVTSSDKSASLNASMLRVQAQKAGAVNGHPGKYTLPGGLGECSDCSHVGIDAVPEGTENVALDVIMPTDGGVTSGCLFLGSIMV